MNKTQLKVNNSYEGETIEEKVRRIVNNKEPITDGAPLIYNDRKDGALPEYDITTDRWEVAVEAMDKVHKSNAAKREAKIVEMEKAKKGENAGGEQTKPGGEAGGQSTQGTETK